MYIVDTYLTSIKRVKILPYTANVRGGNFRGFSPMNYGLVDWQCKSTSMLAQKFSREWQFCTLTVKVFPLKSFAVYGSYLATLHGYTINSYTYVHEHYIQLYVLNVLKNIIYIAKSYVHT